MELPLFKKFLICSHTNLKWNKIKAKQPKFKVTFLSKMSLSPTQVLKLKFSTILTFKFIKVSTWHSQDKVEVENQQS